MIPSKNYFMSKILKSTIDDNYLLCSWIIPSTRIMTLFFVLWYQKTPYLLLLLLMVESIFSRNFSCMCAYVVVEPGVKFNGQVVAELINENGKALSLKTSSGCGFIVEQIAWGSSKCWFGFSPSFSANLANGVPLHFLIQKYPHLILMHQGLASMSVC